MDKCVEVVGEAQNSFPPDIIRVKLAIETNSKVAVEATRALIANATRLQSALGEFGLTDSALSLQSIHTSPHRVYKKNEWIEAGINASSTLEVKLETEDQLAEIIDLALANGASSLAGVKYDVKDKSGKRAELRIAAIENARQQAEIYAKAAKAKIGAVVKITDSEAAKITVEQDYRIGEARGGGGGGNLPSAAVRIVVRVFVSWSLM